MVLFLIVFVSVSQLWATMFVLTTVKLRFTDTRLIPKPRYYLLRTVCFVHEERKPLHFFKFNPLNTDTPLIRSLSMTTFIFYAVLTGWLYFTSIKYSCGKTICHNCHSNFFKLCTKSYNVRQRSHLVPGHGARVRYSLGTNVNTPFFQVPAWLCTQSHIGYSKCQHNTILCRYPDTGSRAPSVDSSFLRGPLTEISHTTVCSLAF